MFLRSAGFGHDEKTIRIKKEQVVKISFLNIVPPPEI